MATVRAASLLCLPFRGAGAQHTKGKTAALLFAGTAFSASHYHEITRVTIGEQPGAAAAMLTFFGSSAATTEV